MKRIFQLALWLGVLIVAVSVPSSSPTQAAGPPPPSGTVNVDVVNTPLPVSGTINVGNFPASSAVTGSMSITGTPNVNVTNNASDPVPTQNVGGGAATQVGQPASHLINLYCTPFSCVQVLSSGQRATTVFTVPTTSAFVITDVQWIAVLSLQGTGNYDGVFVNVNNLTVTVGLAPVDSGANSSGLIHLGNVVAAPGASIALSPAFAAQVNGFIQGYLVPNQ